MTENKQMKLLYRTNTKENNYKLSCKPTKESDNPILSHNEKKNYEIFSTPAEEYFSHKTQGKTNQNYF